VKKIGESQIRPMASQDLSGWRIRSMSFGHESFAICCDSNTARVKPARHFAEPRRPWVPGCEESPAVITWGQSKYGELGYGGTKKSSANPSLVEVLHGTVAVKQICAGMGHIVYLLNPDADASAFPDFEPPEFDPKNGWFLPRSHSIAAH
ncbi:hypothetical protein T484DRAFT_1777326, partial [Baffinella frigidus]